MKTLLAIATIVLLTACPTKTTKKDPVDPPVKDDAAAPIDAKVVHPIVRDERLQMVKDEKEVAYSSVPMKLDEKIGFGLFAVTERVAAVKLDPAEVTLKFLGKHEEGRWKECLSVKPHLDGKELVLAAKPTHESTASGKLVIETMSVVLTRSELEQMAFAKELKVWLCEDIVTFKAEDQTLLQAMDSELRSPRTDE
jgi:hypothetical protein